MATDGVKIIDGDLAFDIYSIFMDMYDAGNSIEEIRQAVEVPFDEEDGFDYEIFITTYALALWQTGQLSPDILQELDTAIARGAGVKVWTEEVNSKEGQKRQRELEKLRQKLSQPTLKVRKRKVYKPLTKFLFEEDAVLVFKLPNSNYCAAILTEVFQYQGRCTYYFVVSTYAGSHKPSIEDIRAVEVIGRIMPAGFDYQIGLGIIAVSPKNLRLFASKLEQVGKLEIAHEFKKAGVFGGAINFESFSQNWEHQELYSKNLNMDKIPLKEIL